MTRGQIKRGQNRLGPITPWKYPKKGWFHYCVENDPRIIVSVVEHSSNSPNEILRLFMKIYVYKF